MEKHPGEDHESGNYDLAWHLPWCDETHHGNAGRICGQQHKGRHVLWLAAICCVSCFGMQGELGDRRFKIALLLMRCIMEGPSVVMSIDR